MSLTDADFTLCLVTRKAAEDLMGAPKLAGGWVAVHPECAQAVEIANYEGYIALLPSAWPEARNALTREQAQRIADKLGGKYAGPVANEFAARVSEALS